MYAEHAHTHKRLPTAANAREIRARPANVPHFTLANRAAAADAAAAGERESQLRPQMNTTNSRQHKCWWLMAAAAADGGERAKHARMRPRATMLRFRRACARARNSGALKLEPRLSPSPPPPQKPTDTESTRSQFAVVS